MANDDAFFDKAIEGWCCSLQPGRGLHLPVPRADPRNRSTTSSWNVLERASPRSQGSPLDTDTMIGAQASPINGQDHVLPGDRQGRKAPSVLIGGERGPTRRRPGRRLLHPADGVQGHNKMRIFQEEIFGPVLAVDHLQGRSRSPGHRQRHRLHGLGAGVWSATAPAPTAWAAASRPAAVDQLLPRLPAHAAFGGYKESGHRSRNGPLMFLVLRRLLRWQRAQLLVGENCPARPCSPGQVGGADFYPAIRNSSITKTPVATLDVRPGNGGDFCSTGRAAPSSPPARSSATPNWLIWRRAAR